VLLENLDTRTRTGTSKFVSENKDFLPAVDKIKVFLRTRYALEGLTNLENVAGRMWFKRVWIIQELMLDRSALLKCGRDEIFWFKFSSIIRLLNAAIPYSSSPWNEFGDHHSRIRNLQKTRLLAKFNYQLPITNLSPIYNRQN
jgi:hypothetical protein